MAKCGFPTWGPENASFSSFGSYASLPRRPPTTAPNNPPAAPTAASGQPGGTSAAPTAERATETPTALPGPVKAKIGQRSVLPGVALTVTKVEQSAGTDADQPEAGNKFVIVHVTFENTGNLRLDVGANQFEFVDSSGVVYNSLENLTAASINSSRTSSIHTR